MSKSVTTAAIADIGRKRTEQQDSLGYVTLPTHKKTLELARAKGYFYVVADGVGGAEAGGLASRLAVETIIERYYREPATDVEESLAKAIKRANQKILQESEKRDFLTMHTTVVCAVIRGKQLYVAHLGDSRAYLMRSGELTRLTRDHSRVQALIDDQKLTEEEARSHPERNLITRSLGYLEDIEPEISRLDIYAGDLLLLCSDGLHGEVRDEEIAKIILADTSPQIACQALLEQANLSGGRDNISVILTRIEAIEEVTSQINKISPPTPRQIRKWRHTMLAESAVDWPLFEKIWRGWQKYWALVMAMMVIMMLSLVIVMQTRRVQQLQTDLDRTHKNIERIIQDYQQGEYGEVDPQLRQNLEEIREQLEAGFSSPLPTATPPIIIPSPTVPPHAPIP